MAKAKKKSLIAGFKDPASRPRYIMWTGMIVICFAAFIAVALAVSSSRLFCAQVCHKVQDDSIVAYERSSHSEISCLACHMPVEADPITFLIHKAEAGILGGLHTVTDKFIVPLNKGSVLSLEANIMRERNCTQCHSANRKITPSPGIIIDHKIHSEKGVTCTMCHNRVAHPEEGLTFVTKDPQTGKMNPGHPNFMKMKYCFRCHELEGGEVAAAAEVATAAEGAEAAEGGEGAKSWKATGACSACHPADFQLKPENHFEAGFYPKGHAEMGKEDEEEMKEAAHEAEVMIEEGIPAQLAEPVSYCGSCHVKSKFCNGCHGMEIPHPEEFKTKEHPEVVKTSFAKCVMCHGEPAATGFCDDCHHGKKVSWTFDKAVPWKTQHAAAVTKNGIDNCFTACHKQEFCLDCHTRTKPLPSSHKAGNWLHRSNPDPFAKDKAVHAKNAANIKSCEICHGAGGTGSAFCMSCHKLPMPHAGEFKKFHSKTGRDDPKMCQNCHQFKEICNNCHHVGSNVSAPWQSLHAAEVNKDGGAGCFKACHKKDFCVACHTKLKALPATHKQAGWTKRPALDQKALHPAAFSKSADNCSFCHGDGGAGAAFCTGCHKMPMPHASGFGAKDKGGQHQADLKAGKVAKAACDTCHTSQFCNKCHHDYTGATPWITTHDDVVKASDPSKCFAKCHKETFCSYCHVRLPRR